MGFASVTKPLAPFEIFRFRILGVLAVIKTRRPALLLTLGAAILLTVGGAAAYWWLSQRRITPGELPVGAAVIPQSALMTFSFSTEERQWQRLREFGTPESQAQLDQFLADMRDRLLTDNGYIYQRDIRPWIGQEMTIAFLSPPVERSGAPNSEAVEEEGSTPDGLDSEVPAVPTTREQSMVLVMPIANPVQAQRSLQRSNNTALETVAERTYKGLEIREVQGQSDQIYSTTVLDGELLVMATDGAAIEQVIDTHQGRASLVDTPGYEQALAQVEVAQPFLRFYLNIPATQALALTNSPQPPSEPFAMPGVTLFRNQQGFAAAVTLESEGLQLQGLAWLDPNGGDRHGSSNTARRMPSLLPAQTLMMVSGGNLQQLWEDHSQQPTVSTQNPFHPQNLRSGLQSLTGLSLDEDLMPWMSGEFSLALVPTTVSTESSGASLSAGLVLLVQASDRRAANQALEKLDQAVSQRYGFRVGEAQLAGRPVINWTSPFAALTVTRGWLEGNVAFLALGGPVASTILPSPGTSLSNNERFQAATASDLTSNNGHFFVDFSRLSEIGNVLPLPQLPPSNQVFVSAIQAIGVTTAIQDERSTRYDVHVLMPRTTPARALPEPSPRSDSPQSDLPPSENPLSN